VIAVDELQLEIREGSVYALVGPNGAGKTTVLKMLLNLLRPDAGHAKLLGTDSRRISARDFEAIAYVSENQELPEWMTVEYFLAYLKPFYPSWDDLLADELVRELDLPRDRRLRHLSRGMKMKAALAASLAYHPRVIVLDEPFSGLDPLVRDEFIQGLIPRAADTTILVSSHDLAEVESFASHIGYLDAGRLRFSEELASLSDRFREIEITLDQSMTLPSPWPADWLRPQTSSAVVRFVDSGFEKDRTPQAIRQMFPSAAAVSIKAMPLREIFVAVARDRRKAA
jgi:ABC-2 type transport system ATP-binding protein